MPKQRQFVIISAFNVADTALVNSAKSSDLAEDLRNYGFDFDVCAGMYHGFEEQSFRVFVENGVADPAMDTLLALANAYGQESILHVDSDGLAYLCDASGDTYIGKWTLVSEREAVENRNYTHTGNGEYFIAKKQK